MFDPYIIVKRLALQITKAYSFAVINYGVMGPQLKTIQYNLNGSNTDGSFTVDDSNSFFSPYKILPVAPENKNLMIFFLF